MHRKQWRIISAGVIGNIIEYYDFALIGFLAVMMGELFFPSSNPTLSLIGSFSAFAAGMIMRPIGAIFFGHIGDKIGRKYALIGSLILMALPTFLIGFLPTYAQIGILAPILLVLLRMIQGFSVGGEYASSIVYLVEEAPHGNGNLYGSFVSLGAKIGMALGAGLCGFLLAYLGEDAMREWGWRVPFWLSLVIALTGIYLRKGLSDNYHPKAEKKIPIVEILKHHRKEFYEFLLIASAIWLLYYTLFVYLPIWLQHYAHLSKLESSSINTYSIIMGVIFIPLMAMIADKIGSLKLMSYASLALTILIYPIFYIMNSGVYMLIILGVAMMVLLICSFQAPIFASTVRAIKEHGYRASFTAVILGSAAGIVGGLTPALMTSLQEITKDPFAPAYLIATTSLISFFVIKRKLSLEINKN